MVEVYRVLFTWEAQINEMIPSWGLTRCFMLRLISLPKPRRLNSRQPNQTVAKHWRAPAMNQTNRNALMFWKNRYAMHAPASRIVGTSISMSAIRSKRSNRRSRPREVVLKLNSIIRQ